MPALIYINQSKKGAAIKEFEDRVAVVTGAASGIGRAMSRSFLEAGMKVVLADIDEKRLENTRHSFKEFSANLLWVQMDVSQADQVEALARKTLETFGAVLRTKGEDSRV